MPELQKKSLLKRGVLWGIALLCVVAAAYFYKHKSSAEVASNTGKASEEQPDKGAQKEGAGSHAAGSGGSGRRGGRGGRNNGPVAVRVVSAKIDSLDRTVETLGTVVPVSTVTVRSRVEGVLEHIYFREGQLVEKGHVLAQVERAPLEIQKRQIEGLVQKDRAVLENAKADLVRYRTLAAQEAGSKQQRDTQVALVGQSEGTLKTDQAQLDNVRLQLGYTKITAPITGRIGLKQLDVGNLIKAGDTSVLAVITQLSPITVIFSIPQNQLSSVMEAMRHEEHLKVEAFDSNASKQLASGSLMAVDNQIDPTTGTVKLKAVFENKDSALFPSQFVNMTLHVEHLNNVLTLPIAAVQHSAAGAFVYVLKPDQTVSMRPVKEGLSKAGQVIVTEGLTEGERVVMEGIDGLRDGAKVKVITQ